MVNPQSQEERYQFADFTHDAYKSLLINLLDQGYKFISYSEIDEDGPWVLWRHDLDFSPQRALKLAKIEAELGLKSTFFLLPHSRFYNLFEKEVSDIIEEIKSLGHHIGLHFDFAHYQNQDLAYPEKMASAEKQFLETVFQQEISSFSFHNPNQWALEYGEPQFAGMTNAYAKFFMNEVAYASDSNGHWRNDSIAKRISEAHPKVQILTHPVWWTEMLTSPKERVWAAIEGRAQANIEKQLQHWKQWGRELPDW